MEKVDNKFSVFKKIKRDVCVGISRNILAFYGLFRSCSGLDIVTKKKMSEYEQNEKEVRIIKRELPVIKQGIDELKEENFFLKDRLNYALNDLYMIKYLVDRGNYNGVYDVLNKYDFSNIVIEE